MGSAFHSTDVQDSKLEARVPLIDILTQGRYMWDSPRGYFRGDNFVSRGFLLRTDEDYVMSTYFT